MHGLGSRHKLTPWHAHLYSGDTVLDALGRALCTARCLPRKELHEAWELAALVRAQFTGVRRIVDLCCGFAVLPHVMLLLDDDVTTHALAVDVKLPQNHLRVHQAITAAFPQLRGRVQFTQAPLDRVALQEGDLVVSVHACGALTDAVLAHAAAAHVPVAVLPCCHVTRFRADLVDVADPANVIDDERAARMTTGGYRVISERIPEAVSPKNRVLLAAPAR
jgi:hypothetical protein